MEKLHLTPEAVEFWGTSDIGGLSNEAVFTSRVGKDYDYDEWAALVERAHDGDTDPIAYRIPAKTQTAASKNLLVAFYAKHTWLYTGHHHTLFDLWAVVKQIMQAHNYPDSWFVPDPDVPGLPAHFFSLKIGRAGLYNDDKLPPTPSPASTTCDPVQGTLVIRMWLEVARSLTPRYSRIVVLHRSPDAFLRISTSDGVDSQSCFGRNRENSHMPVRLGVIPGSYFATIHRDNTAEPLGSVIGRCFGVLRPDLALAQNFYGGQPCNFRRRLPNGIDPGHFSGCVDWEGSTVIPAITGLGLRALLVRVLSEHTGFHEFTPDYYLPPGCIYANGDGMLLTPEPVDISPFPEEDFEGYMDLYQPEEE